MPQLNEDINIKVMINQVGYWENAFELESVRYRAFLDKHQRKLDALKKMDIFSLPEIDQKRHYDKIEYIQNVIAMFTSILNMIENIKSVYWESLGELANDNLDLHRQIITLTASNKFLISMVGKIKIKSKPDEKTN